MLEHGDWIYSAIGVRPRTRKPDVAEKVRPIENVVDPQIEFHVGAVEQEVFIQLGIQPGVVRRVLSQDRK